MRKVLHIAVFMLLALPCAVATAAPMAYSVNSDQPLGDKLHSIDLVTGGTSVIGIGVFSQGPSALSDIEGLAVAPDSSLWGVDEQSMSLFEVDTSDGTAKQGSEVSIKGLDEPEKNDFGLTFTCAGDLYATSVVAQSLYKLDLDGTATRVGAEGSLGVNISAIASFGTLPEKLYGLGNGLQGDQGQLDNRSLYQISLEDGVATFIGEIGDEAADYEQAGLSFDGNGNLWAITDRSRMGKSSQILLIDPANGSATVQATTDPIGFESLAIAPPVGCALAQKDGDPLIPVMGVPGKFLTILALMLTGFLALRYRIS